MKKPFFYIKNVSFPSPAAADDDDKKRVRAREKAKMEKVVKNFHLKKPPPRMHGDGN